jgi:hypothetical protein
VITKPYFNSRDVTTSSSARPAGAETLPAMNPAEAVRCSPQIKIFLSFLDCPTSTQCRWLFAIGREKMVVFGISAANVVVFFWNFLKSNQCLLDFVHICLGWLEKIDNEKQARASERTVR